MSGIGIIFNPHSRSNRKHPQRAERLGFIVGDKGSCHATQKPEDVEGLAHHFKERQIEVLGISGGDGTIHTALTTFLKVYGETPLPQIALLRGGTMNNTATNLGIYGTPEDILSKLILNYHTGSFKTTPLSLLEVNGRYGFVFGMGVVTRFLQEFEERNRGHVSPGKAAVLLAQYMLASICNTDAAKKMCEHVSMKVTVNGEVLPFPDYVMLFAGSVESLCFQFRPMWRARERSGQFHFMGISSTPRQLLSVFPRAWFKLPIKKPFVIDRVGQEMTLECENPEWYTIDGEFPEPPVKQIKLNVGPTIQVVLL